VKNRKLYAVLLMAFMLVSAMGLFAQETTEDLDAGMVTEEVNDTAMAATEETPVIEESAPVAVQEETVQDSFFKALLKKSGLQYIFEKGGFVMYPMLLITIWVLATIIWKLIVLQMAKINSKKFIVDVTKHIASNKIDQAISLCEKTRGPVANIIHAGLLKANGSVEQIEKAIENAGTIEMGFLERGLLAIATGINLAPMFGFLGTTTGMIAAFEAIAAAGEVEPTIVASGISEALLTTAAGLALAIAFSIPYNFFITQIDGLILDMEESSAKIVEQLMEIKTKNNA